MRDRLLLAFVVLTLVLVAVFMVVRGYTVAQRVHIEQRHDLERSAETLAVLLPSSARQISSEKLRSLLYDGERVYYVDGDGAWVQAAQHASAADDEMPQDLSVVRPVEGGGRVTLSLRGDVVDAQVATALLPLVVVSLVLAGLGVLLSIWLSRRLARPFRELADVAEAVVRGEYDVTVPRYRLPEADALARALRTSAAELDVLTRRERQFAAHASHALRTPITAARLELEDLAIAPETPPDVVGRLADAVEQLDRLSSTVAGMLDESRDRVASGVDIDLAALVRDVADRWRRSDRGLHIDASCDAVVAVRLPVGPLVQVMDALIAHAVNHGAGTVRVTVSEEAEYAEVRVADQGDRSGALAGATARGREGDLATATEIVEAMGGRLRLADEQTTTYSLVLPLRRRASVAS